MSNRELEIHLHTEKISFSLFTSRAAARSYRSVACCCCSSSEDHCLLNFVILIFLIALKQIFEKKSLDNFFWFKSIFFLF